MTAPSHEELEQFINALQLCIKTKVHDIKHLIDGSIKILFANKPIHDSHLDSFSKLVDGVWNETENSLGINDPQKIDWPTLTYFLFLTRMKKENMLKLAEVDSKYSILIDRLGFKTSHYTVENIRDAAALVFKTVELKGITLRKLSEKTGLTQASLSKFKAGGDIRLSNLIKISKALGLRIKIFSDSIRKP